MKKIRISDTRCLLVAGSAYAGDAAKMKDRFYREKFIGKNGEAVRLKQAGPKLSPALMKHNNPYPKG